MRAGLVVTPEPTIDGDLSLLVVVRAALPSASFSSIARDNIRVSLSKYRLQPTQGSKAPDTPSDTTSLGNSILRLCRDHETHRASD